MNALKLLVIVIVIGAVTLLGIRSGQAMAKSSIPPGTVYYTTDSKQGTHDRGKLLAVTTTSTALTSSDSTNISTNVTNINDSIIATFAASINVTTIYPIPIHEWNETHSMDTEDSTPAVTEERAAKNHTIVEHVQTVSRSLNNRTNHNDLFGHPSTSRSRSQPNLVHGKLIKTITYPTSSVYNNPVSVAVRSDENNNDDEDTNDNNENREAKIIVDAGKYYTKNRPHYRQMIRDDYSTVDADISVAEEDGSTGYHNSYDLTYDAAGNQKAPWTGWNAMGQPGQVHPGPTDENIMAPSRHTLRPYPYQANYKQIPGLVNHNNFMPPNMNYQLHHPNSQVEQYNIHSPLQHIQMIYDKMDWHKIGILVLIKLGLVKLKIFSFLKLLFLLVFKLKLFLIAIFFKFLLIMKLMKFLKVLTVPLILLALLPLLSLIASPMLVGGLLTIPNRLLEFFTEPVFVPSGSTVTKNSVADPTILPSATSAAKTSSSTLYEFDNLSLINRRRLDILKILDPSRKILRKVLNLDKCVERIACRMAVVEKIGIMPVWISWMLQRLSKIIPNEKLETYLKTYDDVNNIIYSKSMTQENWATWCLERYTCGNANIDNITNVMDSKH